jgi:Skp family chaperone for outer membrane proteins
VAIPAKEAQRQGDKPRDSHGDISRTIRALETAVSTLGKQLDAERGRADKAEAALASEREARVRAEAEAAQLRQQDQARRSARLVERIITALRPPR